MSKVMVTIQSPDGALDLAQVKARYGLGDDDIDAGFGVVEIDPTDGTYTVLVEPAAAARITGDKRWAAEGPFSNPRIQPFGPPEADHDPNA